MKKTLEQIEAERLSRRQALGRIGFLAGASAVAALTSDELLRKVGAEMQKRAGDNQIANAVAKEFQNAGVAFATIPVGFSCSCDQSTPPQERWWYCASCGATNPTGFWPALDCTPGFDSQKCCQDQYLRCLAAYGNTSQAQTTCSNKRAECKGRIPVEGA
jgi:hypothetical protein